MEVGHEALDDGLEGATVDLRSFGEYTAVERREKDAPFLQRDRERACESTCRGRRCRRGWCRGELRRGEDGWAEF